MLVDMQNRISKRVAGSRTELATVFQVPCHISTNGVERQDRKRVMPVRFVSRSEGQRV